MDKKNSIKNFYLTYKDEVRGWLKNHYGHFTEEEREDMFSKAMLVALQGSFVHTTDAATRGWFYETLKRLAKEIGRQKTTASLDIAIDVPDKQIWGALLYMNADLQKKQVEIVSAAMQQLSIMCQCLLDMAFFKENRNAEDLAAACNCSSSHAATQSLHRCFKQLVELALPKLKSL